VLRDEMQIMVAQHHHRAVAELAHEAQRLE